MDRREFLVTSAAASGLALFGTIGLADATTTLRAGGIGTSAPGPYGPPGAANASGLHLPDDFRSRVIATTGELVGDTDYRWHPNPDGGATFELRDGGWVYVSNDESDGHRGGVSMVRFDSDGRIIGARRILDGSNRNCAGGATPWGTWLSCEEFGRGRVWECDPLGVSDATVRPAMGIFRHEAAAVDSDRQVIYLTEDRPDGGLYRFIPDIWQDLSAGRLQVLARSGDSLEWSEVPDPSAESTPTREQLDTMIRFDGGEGAWFEGDDLYFTTKGDNRVWRLNASSTELEVIYDIDRSSDPVLGGVDNIAMTPSGDLFVCEDGGNMEIVMLTSDGLVAPFLRLEQSGSELTGVAFDPSGTRMYFSSQRGPGRTFEVTGPFRGLARPTAAATRVRRRSRVRSQSSSGGHR